MSAPESKVAAPVGGVDVLAVLDRTLRDLIDDDYATTDSPWANDFREARAAVAELVEAAQLMADLMPDAELETDAVQGRIVADLRAALAPFQAGGAE